MTYTELQEKYRISYNENDKDNSDYDIVVSCIAHRYGKNVYRVYRNTVNLYGIDLATICDKGEPPFGYSDWDDEVVIYTD